MRSASKKPEKDYERKIIRLKDGPAACVGRVLAPDADSAIKKASVEYEITNPEHQKRLVAQRVS